MGGVEHGEVGDYYALLGLGPTASAREIRAAFRQLAKRLHPDVSALPGAAERFRRIVAAYETLSDPVRRAAYDSGYRPAPAAPRTSGPGVTYGPTGTPVAPAERPSPGDNGGPSTPPRGPRPARGAPVAPGARRAVRPRGPATPVTPVAPVGAVGPLSAGERARRAAEAIRAGAVRGRCVECGALVAGDSDRCPACLRKYGTFQEHLARAAARVRRS